MLEEQVHLNDARKEVIDNYISVGSLTKVSHESVDSINVIVKFILLVEGTEIQQTVVHESRKLLGYLGLADGGSPIQEGDIWDNILSD